MSVDKHDSLDSESVAITDSEIKEKAYKEFKELNCSSLSPFVPLMMIKNIALSFRLHYPMLPFFKYKRPRATVYMCGRQEGKCYSMGDDSRIRRANGYPAKPKDIGVGDLLLTKNAMLRASSNGVKGIFDNGVKPLLRITTRRGSVMELTRNHRVYTIDGYKNAEKLTKDDFLFFPKKAGLFLDKREFPDRIIVTAYLLGDGSIQKKRITFTSGSKECADEFMACVCGESSRSSKPGEGAESMQVRKGSIIYDWMEEDGLIGSHSADKFIPEWVFDLPKDQTRLFISRLWATDGSIKRYVDNVCVTYCSKSKDMIYQLQALLTKFGIISGIRRKKTSYKKDGRRVGCGYAYELRVETRECLAIFMREFSVPGKPKIDIPETISNNNRHVVPIGIQSSIRSLFSSVLEKSGDSLRSRGLRATLKYNISYHKLKKYLSLAEHLGLTDNEHYMKIKMVLESDFSWDCVKSVEEIAPGPTADMEIDEDHNYLLNGLVVHNSVSLGAASIIRSKILGYYDILFVQPRFEQIKRFSTSYVEPMLTHSPLASAFSDDTRESSIMSRPIKGGGSLYFAHAFFSPDATRGYTAQELIVDEAQDISSEFIPIIEEVLSAQTEYGFRMFSGTPKTHENTLATQYRKSSQAHVHITCQRCSKENIAADGFHIYKMIGKKGCICAHCGGLLDLTRMRYIHHKPELRKTYEGYHIPQIIHPLHAYFPEKWADLLDKFDDPMYSDVAFNNEKLGLPDAHNNTPITELELIDSCDPETPNSLKRALVLCKKATNVVMGVDWSGFGASGESTTVVAVGITNPGEDAIRIVYLERLSVGLGAEGEADRIRLLYNNLGCHRFSHDFSGAGVIREALIVQKGMNKKRIIPFSIVSAPVRSKIISYYKPADGGRSCYNIDKTRSLMVLYQMLKKHKIVLPSWDTSKDVVSDFLHITIESRNNPRGADYIIMDKIEGAPDDCVHAINFACSTIWHAAGRYPEMAPLMSNDDYEGAVGASEDREARRSRLAELGIKAEDVH